MAQRQPTAQRMATGMRMGTAARKEANLSGVGYNTKVTAIDRPVTNHGMSGIKVVNQGPGRQIYDRSYYFNLLKNKNNELHGEINKMKVEVEDINKDNTTFLTLERQYEALIKDVRKYEGELADYNLALDKYRSDTKPDDIEALYMHIKMQNDKQKNQLDALFSEKRDMESEIQNAEDEMQQISYHNESKLNELDPEQRNEYEKLKEENIQLNGDIQNSRNELEDVHSRLVQADGKLKGDTLKQRAQHLKEEKAQLLKRKEDLELQSNDLNLPLPEARQRLQDRIKQDNAEIKVLEKEAFEMQKVVGSYQNNIKEIETDLKENNVQNNDESKKYEVLQQKEQEMNKFMQEYEEEKAAADKEIADLQNIIAPLLEHMQKSMAKQNKLPSQDQFKDMKADLKFKNDQVEKSETTAARLKVQKEQIENDLTKVKNLEGRITGDQVSTQSKIDDMQGDMDNKFTKTDDLKSSFDMEKKRMNLIKQFLNQYKNGLSKQITYHSMKHDTKKNQILQSEIYNRLNEMEKKLIQNESQIYSIQQYIEAKGVESNYQQQFADCMGICSEINMDLIKRCMAIA